MFPTLRQRVEYERVELDLGMSITQAYFRLSNVLDRLDACKVRDFDRLIPVPTTERVVYACPGCGDEMGHPDQLCLPCQRAERDEERATWDREDR